MDKISSFKSKWLFDIQHRIAKQKCTVTEEHILSKYCVQTITEEQCLLKSVYSIILVIQITSFLYKMETGEKSGARQRERERKREAELGSRR